MISGIKYSTDGTFSNSRRKGNWLFLDDGHLGGTTTETGFYTAIQPPEGGYTLYINKTTGGPSIHVFNNDSELLDFCNNILGANQPTVDAARDWIISQDNYFIDPEYDSTVFAFSSDVVEQPPIFTFTPGNEPSGILQERNYISQCAFYIIMNGIDVTAGINAFNTDFGSTIISGTTISFSYDIEPPLQDRQSYEESFWSTLMNMNNIGSGQYYIDAGSSFINSSSQHGGRINVLVPMRYYTVIPIGFGTLSSGDIVDWGDGTTSTYNGNDLMNNFCAHYYDIPGPFNITISTNISNFNLANEYSQFPTPYVPFYDFDNLGVVGKIKQFAPSGNILRIEIRRLAGYPGKKSGIAATNLPGGSLERLFIESVNADVLPLNLASYTFTSSCEIAIWYNDGSVSVGFWENVVTTWASSLLSNGTGVLEFYGMPLSEIITTAYQNINNKGYTVVY